MYINLPRDPLNPVCYESGIHINLLNFSTIKLDLLGKAKIA